jgi:glucose/arabinose dehydrogenase
MRPYSAFSVLGLLFAGSLAASASSSAAPKPLLDIVRARGGRALVARVGAASSFSGCTVSLRAAARARTLDSPNGGVELARGSTDEALVTFTARMLPEIQQPVSGRRRIFLMARALCGAESAASGPASFAPPQSANGLRPRVWLQRAKTGKVSAGAVSVEEAFPNLPAFASPTDIQSPNDGTNRIFVNEQPGRIYFFSNDPAVSQRTLFLDISSLVESGGQEQGLLGLAFHPDFAHNGVFFVHYSQKGSGNTQLARYHVKTGDPAQAADPASGEVILEVKQPFANHNGGQIAFGPDGFLYMALGDGGSGGDPFGNGQNRSVLLGKLLRIDVDSASPGKKYGIPPSNPFAGSSTLAQEIYAYGLRNPWRFSFDPPTGRLWVADVGQDAREEVDLVTKGGNYGWNIMEGFACYKPPVGCDQNGLILPVVDYTHAFGIAITGGYVYRGGRVPALTGLFLYGDFGSGRIWGLRYAGGNGSALELAQSGLNISTFGIDRNGEVYLASYSNGKLYRFK